MSAQPPTALEGTQAPSQIEFLWERYRPLVWTIVVALMIALAGNYGFKYYKQKTVDSQWSGFVSLVGLDDAYTQTDTARSQVQRSLTEELRSTELTKLEAGMADATDAQKPYLLLAIARKAILESQWDRAESALAELEQKYPHHSLVKATDYPVQVREVLDPKAVSTPQKPPDLKPAEAGSAVTKMRSEIAAARVYSRPSQFQRIDPPADAKKVQIEFSNGSKVVIALMGEHAPKHVDAFLKFATEGEGWKGMAVDEIQRPTGFNGQPRQMHLGYASTREEDRTKWTTTDPSTNPLEFEASKLSHFPGAVSGRVEADGKSSVDRFWIVADDAPRYDGERVVFGYVVEGLEQVQRICDESMSAQEEQAGRGRPTENIRVTGVSVLP